MLSKERKKLSSPAEGSEDAYFIVGGDSKGWRALFWSTFRRSTTPPHKMLSPPLNFNKWVEENKHKLQPPVGNFCLFKSKDYTVMVVGGPNARSDYHFQPTEEFFYQVKGAMLLKVVEDGQFKDVRIGEGEMFMLPANTPHSPCRFEDTIGLVVERTRPAGEEDAMRWYCPNLAAHDNQPHVVKESRFFCTDLGTQLKPVIDAWKSDATARKCSCGYEQGERELIGELRV